MNMNRPDMTETVKSGNYTIIKVNYKVLHTF